MPAPDYENDLAFEPQFTWGDLIENCRHYDLFSKQQLAGYFSVGTLNFYSNGTIKASGITIAENRTPSQMMQIIKNLHD